MRFRNSSDYFGLSSNQPYADGPNAATSKAFRRIRAIFGDPLTEKFRIFSA
jgi:hypothetical protein